MILCARNGSPITGKSLIMWVMSSFGYEDTCDLNSLNHDTLIVHCRQLRVCSHCTVYLFRRHENQFTHKNGDFGAISVKPREAVPHRSLRWRVTYRIDVVSSPKVIRYSVNVALLFWFQFTDFWRANEIKTSPTLIYSTSKKGCNDCVLHY